MIDAQRLSNCYDLQAAPWRLWRDDYAGPLVRSVLAASDGMSAVARRQAEQAVT